MVRLLLPSPPLRHIRHLLLLPLRHLQLHIEHQRQIISYFVSPDPHPQVQVGHHLRVKFLMLHLFVAFIASLASFYPVYLF